MRDINMPSDFLSGGGEMGSLTRSFAWEQSTLGHPSLWPPSLRVSIKLLLNSRQPMFIWWGSELIQFYNDAYRDTMGPERHPSALGARGKECWAEIWPIIGPQIDYVLAGKGSTWDEDKLVPVTRHGRREDVWWTYSYNPIDMDGVVGGVLVICNDVTKQHIASARLLDQTKSLTDLFEQSPSFMAMLRGPDHVFEVTNRAYRELLGSRNFVGRKVREVVPEVVDQGYFEMLDEVYRSGTPKIGTRMPLELQTSESDRPRRLFVDFIFQPMFDAGQNVNGIFVQGTDVTQHVVAEDHLKLMNLELKHRVKNTLAMVSAIAGQTMGKNTGPDAVSTFQDRLVVFGRAHDILTATTWATAQLKEVVEVALEAQIQENSRILISGPSIVLGSKQALSLSLALHELATNAAKYGALSQEGGSIAITWGSKLVDNAPIFSFTWEEMGGPATRAPSHIGFGLKLIQRVLQADFGGKVELDFSVSGMVCRITTPSSNLLDTYIPFEAPMT